MGRIYVFSFEKLTDVYTFTVLTFFLVYLCGVMLLCEKISAEASSGAVAIHFSLYLINQHNA